MTLAVPDSKKELRGTIDLLSTCTRGCYAMVAQNFTLIEAKSWNVFLAVKGLSASDAASIQIDSVIVLPSEFYHARVLGPRRNYFVSNCDIIRSNFSKNGSLDRNCVDSVFSLTMGLIGDPFGKLTAFQIFPPFSRWKGDHPRDCLIKVKCKRNICRGTSYLSRFCLKQHKTAWSI